MDIPTSLKERKELFVSNLNGGSTLDIYLVTSISLTSYLAWSLLKKNTTVFDSFNGHLIDFLLNWSNLLLSITIYHNRNELLTILTLLPVLAVSLISTLDKPRAKKGQETSTSEVAKAVRLNLNTINPRQFLPYKTYLTVYRSQMMVITCLAILAVDFQIFPRRFAKVETWGTSLMDLGVGSFVFSMGLVSSRKDIKEKFVQSTTPYFIKLTNSLKQAIPVLILGLIRLISVKSLDYQEHVTEYGKHWNFFITLGLLPFFSSLLSPISKIIPEFLTSLLIGIGYETVLVKTDLMNFILSGDERIGLIAENKEGLFSFIGYYSIFLAGKAAGGYLLPVIATPSNFLKGGCTRSDLVQYYTSKDGKTTRKSFFTVSPLQGLILSSIIYQALYFIIDRCYIFGVSRRMANLLYILWVCAYNTTFLTGYKLVESWIWGDSNFEIVTDKDIKDDDEDKDGELSNNKRNSQVEYLRATPLTLHAVNNNSLVCFLLANVGTGLINMSMNTIDADPLQSMMVLVAYEVALASITLLLLHFNIVLR